jgi:hypothetical protein
MIKVSERRGTVSIILTTDDVKRIIDEMNVGFAKIDLELSNTECVDILSTVATQIQGSVDGSPVIDGAIQVLIWNKYKDRIKLIPNEEYLNKKNNAAATSKRKCSKTIVANSVDEEEDD